MNRRELAQYSIIKSIPILCSYLFVSMAYGILMEEAGFHWYDSLLVSLTVYTGAFQFVFTSLLSAGASIVYCLRGINGDITHTGVTSMIAVLLTAASYRWKHQTLLSIFLGTMVYMIMIRVIS